MLKKSVVLLLADITSIGVDVIVNSANKSLLPGSGLSGLIHKKAGKEVSDYCRTHYQENGSLGVGDVFASPAGKLPAKYIFHAIGPKWYEEEGDEKAEALKRTYSSVLIGADHYHARTVSIPSISTGIHKYPTEFAASTVLECVVNILPIFEHVESVLLVCGSQEVAKAYSKKIATMNVQSVQIINLIPKDIDG